MPARADALAGDVRATRRRDVERTIRAYGATSRAVALPQPWIACASQRACDGIRPTDALDGRVQPRVAGGANAASAVANYYRDFTPCEDAAIDSCIDLLRERQNVRDRPRAGSKRFTCTVRVHRLPRGQRAGVRQCPPGRPTRPPERASPISACPRRPRRASAAGRASSRPSARSDRSPGSSP